MKKRIAIILAGIVIIVAGRGLFYFKGAYVPPPNTSLPYADIALSPLATSQFTDNYTAGGNIVVLVDLAHRNNFSVDELNVLMLRLVSRGSTVKFFKAGDDLELALLGKKEAEPITEQPPATTEVTSPSEEPEKLPGAFIVVSPQDDFSKDDKVTVNKFVDGGNKVLLVADPTRKDDMNNIAVGLGLIFEPGYLYNQMQNENNYQNIFITGFKGNDITKGLAKVVFFAAGVISSADGGLVFTDNNTFSSTIGSRDKLSTIALAKESKVLGVYDLTFMTEPNNGTLDNNQLIANIADWLIKPGEKKQSK